MSVVADGVNRSIIVLLRSMFAVMRDYSGNLTKINTTDGHYDDISK